MRARIPIGTLMANSLPGPVWTKQPSAAWLNRQGRVVQRQQPPVAFAQVFCLHHKHILSHLLFAFSLTHTQRLISCNLHKSPWENNLATRQSPHLLEYSRSVTGLWQKCLSFVAESGSGGQPLLQRLRERYNGQWLQTKLMSGKREQHNL